MYRCEDNGLLWQTEWHDSKKSWCCFFDATWREGKQEWCCTHEGRLCDQVYAAPSLLAKFQLQAAWQQFIGLVSKQAVCVMAILAAAIGGIASLVVRHHAVGEGGDEEFVSMLQRSSDSRSPTGAYRALDSSLEMQGQGLTSFGGQPQTCRDMTIGASRGSNPRHTARAMAMMGADTPLV